MVDAYCDADHDDCRFVLRPDRSLPWRTLMLVYAGIATVCLGVGVFWALQGAWLVLPFAGIEVLALGAAFYLSALRGRDCEIVSVAEETVAVQKGRARPTESYSFPRRWAQVILKHPSARIHPLRLAIRSHGREVELGAFLRDDEREKLAQALARAIGVPLGRSAAAVRPPA
ncbi:DUF2244 domain-containing protein [Ectothiorhodospiraceae bacterium 2226]|nr:DUF2244 domain-containing protein [Ectothiorhodospiraceae bacterium 2226]